MNPELFFYAGSSLLEGPVWVSEENSVYCVAIDQCLIYKIDIDTKEITTFKTESEVGCIIPLKKNYIISAERKGLYKVNTKTGKREFYLQPETDNRMRFNDGKQDPAGRLLIGTKGYQQEYDNQACLYSISNKQAKKLIGNVTISNGLDFSADGKTFFYIDTPTKKVARYEYDPISGKAIFKDYPIETPGAGYPDGLCMDKEGMLWVAEWAGGKVCKWNPDTGKKLQEIYLPCIRVTSCCFGGKNLEYLFITTAKDDKSEFGGGLFKVLIR